MKKWVNKKELGVITLLLIISIGIILFTFNNYFLYKNPILKITDIYIKNSYEKDNGEIYYTENVTGIIKNGKYKGRILNVENYETTSHVYDIDLEKGREIIVELNEDGTKILSIINIKRDKYIVTLIVIFILLLFITFQSQGLKTLLALIINIIISLLAIFIYKQYFDKINILLLFIPISIFFIVFSLICSSNYNKKTLAAIISSLVATFISFLLSYILLQIYKSSIPFWFMDYGDAINDYENLFYVNILLCGLGAIMDIAITMSSSLNELIIKNKNISKKALIHSGKEIGKDIVGSMMNVMFFTIYAGVIPIGLLAIRNNMPLSNVLSNYGQIEMIRILTSCISIVLAIPISQYISIFILKKERSN